MQRILRLTLASSLALAAEHVTAQLPRDQGARRLEDAIKKPDEPLNVRAAIGGKF